VGARSISDSIERSCFNNNRVAMGTPARSRALNSGERRLENEICWTF
jgi:hypothetical protein